MYFLCTKNTFLASLLCVAAPAAQRLERQRGRKIRERLERETARTNKVAPRRRLPENGLLNSVVPAAVEVGKQALPVAVEVGKQALTELGKVVCYTGAAVAKATPHVVRAACASAEFVGQMAAKTANFVKEEVDKCLKKTIKSPGSDTPDSDSDFLAPSNRQKKNGRPVRHKHKKKKKGPIRSSNAFPPKPKPEFNERPYSSESSSGMYNSSRHSSDMMPEPSRPQNDLCELIRQHGKRLFLKNRKFKNGQEKLSYAFRPSHSFHRIQWNDFHYGGGFENRFLNTKQIVKQLAVSKRVQLIGTRKHKVTVHHTCIWLALTDDTYLKYEFTGDVGVILTVDAQNETNFKKLIWREIGKYNKKVNPMLAKFHEKLINETSKRTYAITDSVVNCGDQWNCQTFCQDWEKYFGLYKWKFGNYVKQPHITSLD